jgi:hypothetical protein
VGLNLRLSGRAYGQVLIGLFFLSVVRRYDPLLERLDYRREERKRVAKNLEACLQMEGSVSRRKQRSHYPLRQPQCSSIQEAWTT